LAHLQRQFAYDRLLARLYLFDDAWILKGATALLARHIAVRHTVDVDVYRTTNHRQAEKDLRAAMDLEAGDWFSFEAGRSIPIADAVVGVRVPVVARLGANEWARFHVDVVAAGVRMTGVPENVPPLTSVEISGLRQDGYRAYPIEDHIADKACAILERHGDNRYPSTRYKDLVDLVSLTANSRATAIGQRTALVSEADRRGITLPGHFDVPEPGLWEPGYAAEAKRAVLPTVRTLQAALILVRPYLIRFSSVRPLESGTPSLADGTRDSADPGTSRTSAGVIVVTARRFVASGPTTPAP
jgi:hypothetical protein